MPSSRPRRLFFTLLAIPAFFLLLLFLASPASRQSVADTFSTTAKPPKLPDEIYGLLHFMTSPDEAGRIISAVGDPTPDSIGDMALENEAQLGGAISPDKPVAMSWYALGSIAKTGEFRMRGSSASRGWEERLEVLRERYPLVVFSKACPSYASYCPYSKRAKRLLETYDLLPAPKIIEVDLRADSSHIKSLLTRLTHHSTFPNVILHGRPLGGSDDLMRLHEEGELRQLLEKAGVKVRWTGEGDDISV